MPKLICMNAELAKVYGLPQRDLTEDEALGLLKKQDLGAAHLEDAIAAGAFRREDTQNDFPMPKSTDKEA